MDKHTERTVTTLLARGAGRRKIAKRLSITEWAARKLMTEVADKIGEVLRKDDKQTKPSRKVVKSTRIVSKSSTSTTKTKIEVAPTTRLSSRRHKKIERGISLKVAVLSDIHYPYEDEKACQLADEFLVDWKPDVLVYNGDLVDCYSVSSYEKDVKKKMDIQDELDYAHERLRERKNRLTSLEQTYYLEGNHENRFKRLIGKHANALAALRALTIEDSLELTDLDITYVSGDEELMIGKLMFTHGHMIRKHASSTARGHHEQFGCSVLVGHCHRLAIGFKRNKFGNHAFIENGHLSDFDVEYAKYPDWNHGFCTLEFDGDDFTPTLRHVNNYKLIADGKVYAI